jgi:hypothetical protein
MKIKSNNGIKRLHPKKLIIFINGYVLIQQKFVVQKEHLEKIVENVIMEIINKFVQAMEFVM